MARVIPMPVLIPGGGEFEAYSDFANVEVLVATNLLDFGLRTTDPMQNAFFLHAG